MNGSKQLFALLLVVGLGLGVAACGGQRAEEPAAAPEPAPETDGDAIAGDDFETGDTSKWESRTAENEEPPGDPTADGEDGDGEDETEEDPGT